MISIVLGTISGVLGFFFPSLFWYIGLVIPPVALVLGILGLRDKEENNLPAIIGIIIATGLILMELFFLLFGFLILFADI